MGAVDRLLDSWKQRKRNSLRGGERSPSNEEIEISGRPSECSSLS